MSDELREAIKITLQGEFKFSDGDWLSRLVESMAKEIADVSSTDTIVSKILKALSPAFVELNHPKEVAEEGNGCMFHFLKAMSDWEGIEKWLIKAASMAK